MPRTIKPQLERAAAGHYLKKEAEAVTKDWLDQRPESSPEHISKKRFSPGELVKLAEIAMTVDLTLAIETARNGGVIGHPRKWREDHPLHLISRSLHRDFGYIVGFLEHVRRSMAAGYGFTYNPERGIFEQRVDKSTGKAKATADVLRTVMRDPRIAHAILLDCERRGVEPGMKDVVATIEGGGQFLATPSAAAEATRKPRRR